MNELILSIGLMISYILYVRVTYNMQDEKIKRLEQEIKDIKENIYINN